MAAAEEEAHAALSKPSTLTLLLASNTVALAKALQRACIVSGVFLAQLKGSAVELSQRADAARVQRLRCLGGEEGGEGGAAAAVQREALVPQRMHPQAVQLDAEALRAAIPLRTLCLPKAGTGGGGTA